MMGLGRVWRAVTGGDAEPPPPPPAVPRAPAPPRPAPEAWDPVEIEAGDTRAAERFVPNRTATVLTTADGRRLAARIINISRTGVAVEVEATGFAPGEVALVGTRPVTPGRRIALGLVFRFKKPLDPKLCRPDIVL